MGKISFKGLQKSKKFAVGTWISIPSPHVVDIIASSKNIDFLIFDREHGPSSFETIQNMIFAARSNGKLSIIRPNLSTENEILNSLDISPDGLQFSNISHAEDVEKVLDLCLYPPKGNRGFSPFNKANKYHRSLRPSFQTINNSLTLIFNIEGPKGLDNLDKICTALPKNSIVYIGAYDLSKSLGYPGQVENKIVVKELYDSVKRINSHGLHAGTIASSQKQLNDLISKGYFYLPFLADTEILLQGYENIKV